MRIQSNSSPWTTRKVDDSNQTRASGYNLVKIWKQEIIVLTIIHEIDFGVPGDIILISSLINFIIICFSKYSPTFYLKWSAVPALIYSEPNIYILIYVSCPLVFTFEVGKTYLKRVLDCLSGAMMVGVASKIFII